MRNRVRSAILAGLTTLAFSPGLLAQTAGQPGAAKATAAASTPDLSGVWNQRGRISFFASPVMTPWGVEKYKGVRIGITDPGEQGLDYLDPVQACYPTAPARHLTLNRPFEIIQLPDRVLLLYEFQHERRVIYTDGREHPKGLKPAWMGHSVGRWDKDTLVVDAIGFREETWLDGLGHPHSEAMRYVERFRRVAQDTLEIEFTFNDPEAYTKPWGGKRVFQLRPDWQILEHVNCEDYLMERLQNLTKTR